jgi:hypothetical protein
MPADALFSFAMACNVYLTFFKSHDASSLRRLEWRYLALCYGVPFVPALVFLFIDTADRGRIYGSANVSRVLLRWIFIDPIAVMVLDLGGMERLTNCGLLWTGLDNNIVRHVHLRQGRVRCGEMETFTGFSWNQNSLTRATTSIEDTSNLRSQRHFASSSQTIQVDDIPTSVEYAEHTTLESDPCSECFRPCD